MAYTNNYKGDYYVADLCRFLGLHPSKQYYKSYILECMKNKLELKYGRYKLNQQCIDLMNNHNIYLGWNHSVSKTHLNRMLTQLKINKPDTSIYLILKIYEEGGTPEQLII